MNRRSLLSLTLVAALAACSQGSGATPNASGLVPTSLAAPPGKATSKCISHCGWIASTVYANTPTLETDGVDWEAFQGISSYSSSDDGVATPLASSASLTFPSVPGYRADDQLFRDPAGTFWYIANSTQSNPNGANIVVGCRWSGATNAPCVLTDNWPTLGITNPISIAVDPTGRIAVLNTDETVDVYPANPTASSVPVILSLRTSPIGLDNPVRVGFDTAGHLWVSTTSAPNSQGMLAGYNIGASGNQAPNLTIALASAPIGGCPFAFNTLNQVWAACTDTSGYGHLYNINATTRTLTSRTDNVQAPFTSPVQVATDDGYVYVSDRANQSVYIYSNQKTASASYIGLIGNINHQGGIALQ